MRKVRVALIGSGFIAALHMNAYRRVYGIEVEVPSVTSLDEDLGGFAQRFGIPNTGRDWRAVLADPEIDVVDICTPTVLHPEMTVAAMQAGKHVICEKPFTGYFGRPGDATPIGEKVPKKLMYERAMAEMDVALSAIRASGRLFCYGEDWVYMPAVAKTAEIVRATRDKILFMKAEESHSGSHAAHASHWSSAGGGALMRLGIHPIGTVLWMKGIEARARGETITVSGVSCDVGHVFRTLTAESRTYFGARPADVEDWAMLSLTFSDGTKATIFGADTTLGGTRNLMETYTTGGALYANIEPNSHVVTYLTDEAKLAEVYIAEKVDRKTGWQFVCVDEDTTRGYTGEIQDFMECVVEGRQPRAGIDLAYEAVRVAYAGYWAAEEGRRISF